ncbi:hypothetical protein KXV85_004459, partial [Aspergillus fumigatus]
VVCELPPRRMDGMRSFSRWPIPAPVWRRELVSTSLTPSGRRKREAWVLALPSVRRSLKRMADRFPRLQSLEAGPYLSPSSMSSMTIGPFAPRSKICSHPLGYRCARIARLPNFWKAPCRTRPAACCS